MNPEIQTFLAAIEDSCEHVVVCLEGLGGDAIDWRPVAGANTLAVIARHTLANAERNVLGTFAGQPYEWRREEEFVAPAATADELRASWNTLRGRMRAALDDIPAESLGEPRDHPRMGAVPGRAVLLQAARHAAEHVGEAQLTRSLVLARVR
jgi:hypothetical protein